MPRIAVAWARTSSSERATLTPPPLPRPPAWICALTTQTEPPSVRAASTASCTVEQAVPRGTGTPKRRRMSLPWYSWIFIGRSLRVPSTAGAVVRQGTRRRRRSLGAGDEPRDLSRGRLNRPQDSGGVEHASDHFMREAARGQKPGLARTLSRVGRGQLESFLPQRLRGGEFVALMGTERRMDAVFVHALAQQFVP